MRDYYKVLVVGASGRGKTYMYRNMDPVTTGFVNVEDKPLPFKNEFKHHKRTPLYANAFEAIIEYAKDPEIKVIVIDSFSAYMDSVLSEMRKTKKGFDIWSGYNEEISRFHQLIKAVNKEIFVTAHYEILDIEGTPEKRVKVHGKENEGQIEKHYTMVLYADNKFNEQGKPEYYLSLVGEGLSAKCPPDIFGEGVVSIPNDGRFVLEQINSFVE